jgi:hypothetical protein
MQTPLQSYRHTLQAKSRIKFSTIVRAATCQACNRTFNSAHTWKLTRTIRAFVEKPPGTFANWERKIMTTHFIANPKITTSIAPFECMRQNPATASTELREEMGKLVAQCPVDFGLPVIA